ncbi:MAG: hypothetical protein KDB80_16160, partial [Planctomycetes bacterium]|nr:hypothetical protein [Planctomycetota bacterium]
MNPLSALGLAVTMVAVSPISAQVPCQPPTSYGIGTAGSFGLIPELTTGNRAARVGDTDFAIDCFRARGNTSVGLALSLGSGSSSFLGATILVDLQQIVGVLPHATSTNGYTSFPLPVPPQSSLVGTTVYAQALVADPFAIGGLAASQGLSFTICDTSLETDLRRTANSDSTCWEAQDASCTDLRPALPSWSGPSGQQYAITGIRVVVSEEVTISRVTAVGAAIDEDYTNLDLDLIVYAGDDAFGHALGVTPDGPLPVHHDAFVSLTNPSPPLFGGQSPIGVANRYLEFQFEEFGLTPTPTLSGFQPATYWFVIVRKNAPPDGLVFASTSEGDEPDLFTSDAFHPGSTDYSTFGMNPGRAAVDVFARPPCASFEVSISAINLTANFTRNELRNLAVSAAGGVGVFCFPLFVVEHPLDGSGPGILATYDDPTYSPACPMDGLPAIEMNAARAAVLTDAIVSTLPGETSAYF